MLIGLLGGECTGKTALATALRDELPALVAPEALREFVDATGRTPTQGEQADLMKLQEGLTADAIREAGPFGIVVVDPSAAMTAIYSTIYFGDHSLDGQAREDLQQCDLIVWCQPDFPWEPDGLQRDGEQMRTAAHEAIAHLLRESSIPVVQASGPLSVRVNSVRDALADIGS